MSQLSLWQPSKKKKSLTPPKSSTDLVEKCGTSGNMVHSDLLR